MFELDNRTCWAGGLYPGWNRNRERQLTVVVKAGWAFDDKGALTPLESPPPIEESDRYFGEPDQTSLAAAAETVPFKQGAELLLSGTVHPLKAGSSVLEVSVGLRTAEDRFWEKTLRVFGPRRWEKGLLGIGIGKPAPLQPVSLRYEFAYGGCDPNHDDQLYPPNPVGRGYSRRGWRVRDLELPQIEIGPGFITSPTSRVAPAGFGPIAPFWQPRLKRFDPLDQEAALVGGCPFAGKPAPDLYNAAPPDQRFENPFQGDETLRLKGLIPGAPPDGLLLNLPRLNPRLLVVRGGQRQPLEPVCDTLVVDTDARRLCLLWRAGVPWDLRDQSRGWVILHDPDADSPEEGSGA